MLAAGALPDTAAAARSGIAFPVNRVVCDRVARVCYDSLGASVPLTKAHLGDAAANALDQRISRAGKAWNPNRFVLSNGVVCFVAKKACYVRDGSEEIEPQITQQLFAGR